MKEGYIVTYQLVGTPKGSKKKIIQHPTPVYCKTIVEVTETLMFLEDLLINDIRSMRSVKVFKVTRIQ